MNAPHFEILDSIETDLGVLYLRRRSLLGRPGVLVTEITIGLEPLMSSWHSVSEEALATRALDWHGGEDLDVLVGGLGLGSTAAAALDDARTASVCVIEHLQGVIDWMQRGLVPLSTRLCEDPRLELRQGDVYGLLAAEPARPVDLILIDVDHSPAEPLGPQSERFYSEDGLARAREHLRPDGVLAIWSAEDDPAFVERLGRVFKEARRESVAWENDLIDAGEPVEDFVFLARR